MALHVVTFCKQVSNAQTPSLTLDSLLCIGLTVLVFLIMACCFLQETHASVYVLPAAFTAHVSSYLHQRLSPHILACNVFLHTMCSCIQCVCKQNMHQARQKFHVF